MNIVYDTETFRHLFTCTVKVRETGDIYVYEISRRRNDTHLLIGMLDMLRDRGARMIGFNNEGFDYPVLHHMYMLAKTQGTIDASVAYEKAQRIILGNDRFEHIIWESDRIVPQVDLFKIMHFDNMARSTSLKKLEMNMRSDKVIDLPYPPDRELTDAEMDEMITYNIHDVNETDAFATTIWDRIEFRDALGPEWVNYNDTKIGKQTFIRALEAAGVSCFTRSSGRREPIQTPRTSGVRVGDQLIPIPFETPGLQRVWQTFNALHVNPRKTKGVLDATADLGPFTMHFGVGGIHGSIARETVWTDPDYDIVDVDVTSYYPSLAIEWGFHPAHLGPTFVDVYRDLKRQRMQHPKGSVQNAMLKLALNGVYGDSNNQYGPFYDPAYMLAITTNGQMLLAWLAELLWTRVPGIRLIQINTDGLTVAVPNRHGDTVDVFDEVCLFWQQQSRMTLEQERYRFMAIRDVNNYIAETMNGKRKRKGVYEIDRDWHKNQSSLVVQKAVDAALDGVDLMEFIWKHDDPFDFMRHVKVPRSSRLELNGAPVQGTSRYYMTGKLGGRLVKVMPPLASNPGQERHIDVEAKDGVDLCNDVTDFDWGRLNRLWYYREAKSLLAGLGWS